MMRYAIADKMRATYMAFIMRAARDEVAVFVRIHRCVVQMWAWHPIICSLGKSHHSYVSSPFTIRVHLTLFVIAIQGVFKVGRTREGRIRPIDPLRPFVCLLLNNFIIQ
jgi:hypothetical protein